MATSQELFLRVLTPGWYKSTIVAGKCKKAIDRFGSFVMTFSSGK